jgi:hypothetical protein
VEPARQPLSVQVMLRDDSHAGSVAPSAQAPQDINGYLLAGEGRRSRHASLSYDVLVVGLGSMGAAAVRTPAARGLRVLGLETFGAAHDQGARARSYADCASVLL